MYSPMDISWSVVVVVVPSLTAGELLVELDSADVAGLVGKITTRKLNFNTIRSYWRILYQASCNSITSYNYIISITTKSYITI